MTGADRIGRVETTSMESTCEPNAMKLASIAETKPCLWNPEADDAVCRVGSWYETCRNHEGDITVGIYSGGYAPGKLLYTQKVTPDVDDGFHELTLRTPVSVKPGENLWIVLTAKGTHVISYCRCNEPDNQWVYKDRKFQHLADWKADYAGYGWMIRGYVEAAVDESSIEWKKTTTTERACQLTALTPETDYVVQVRGNYGEEGISQWTTTAFTTVSPCDAPNTLLTSNITPNTASVTWTGYQDNYDLRYRVNLTPDVTADFDDSSLGDWTTIDADGDGYGWVIYTTDTIYHDEECGGYDYVVLPGRGHNGSYDRVISGSYSPFTWEGLSPDNYLVSPQVSLGGTVTFWACAESDLGDHFGLAVSTTGNTDAADFTTIQEWTTDEWQVWKQYTVDLSAYKGQTGYVAIRHFNCYNRFVVAVDDIVIEMPDDGKPWTTVENISGNSYKLTGLTNQTPYKVQVRGNNTPCGTHTPWSEVATFTTLQGGATKIATTDAQQPVINTGWYSIDGRRLNHKPTQKGIYIHNGRKVVM